MATQEQKDKKVAAAAKKVGIVERKIAKAQATLEKASVSLNALAVQHRIAQANLKHAEATPVNGEFEQEAEVVAVAEDNEPAFV